MNKTVIITSGRSGSTKLIESMRQHPDIRVFSEPFNTNNVGSLAEFYPVREGWLTPEEKEEICTAENLDKWMSKYDLCKILYCHILNDVEESLKKYKKVLLVRDLFYTFTSLCVAKQTEQWTDHTPYEGYIQLDLEHLRSFTQWSYVREQYWRKRCDKVIYYIEPTQDQCDSICELMNIRKWKVKETGSQRINRPLEQVIINYSEARRVYANTRKEIEKWDL